MSDKIFKETTIKLADYDDKSVSSLIRKDKYEEAIVLIRKELRKAEDAHWLLACLSCFYY